MAILSGRIIALAVCFGFGVVMFLQYFSKHPVARGINQTISEYWQIIFAFALILGVVSYVLGHLKGISRRQEPAFRIVGLLGFAVMPVLALLYGIDADTPFMWIFENIQAPMQSTVFALLAFFVASASFRGFRARSGPAAAILTITHVSSGK